MNNKQKLIALDGNSEVNLFRNFEKFMKKNNIVSFQFFEMPQDAANPSWHWWRMWVVYTKMENKQNE